MAASRKFSDELRERATRMAVELRADPDTNHRAIDWVAESLGMHPETLRNWVRQAEVDGGVRPGTKTSEAQRLAELERENRELRRANHILRTASAYFAAEPAHSHPNHARGLGLDPTRQTISSASTTTSCGPVTAASFGGSKARAAAKMVGPTCSRSPSRLTS